MTGSAQISLHVNEKGLKYSIGNTKTTYFLTDKNFNSPDYESISLEHTKFAFLQNITISNDVYSPFSCTDVFKICTKSYPMKYRIGSMGLFVSFSILGIIAYQVFRLRQLPNNVYVCDQKMKPIAGKIDKTNIYNTEAINIDLLKVLQTKSYSSSIIRMERNISSYTFDSCISFGLDSKCQRVMNILLKEKFELPIDENLPIEVSLDSKETTILPNSEVHLRSFREFRPVRVQLELSTGQRGYYELPVGVITPMNPLSHLFSIITSIFLDCYNFITTSPYSEANVRTLLDKYMPMLGANQAFFLDNYENLFLYHTLDDVEPVSMELLKSVIKGHDDTMIIETDKIPGVRSLFKTMTNSTETQLKIIFCFPGQLQEHFSRVCLPIVALCTTFVYQLSLLHRTSQKYTSLIDMLSSSKIFSIYKYYKPEGRLEINSTDFVNILTEKDAKEMASLSKPGELNIWYGENNTAYMFESADSSTINILAEDTAPMQNRINDISKGILTAYDFGNQIGFACLNFGDDVSLYKGESFLKRYSLPYDKSFIEFVHSDDRKKLLEFIKELKSHAGSDFISNAVKSIIELNGGEKRYMIPQSLLGCNIEAERSKKFGVDIVANNCSIRLIDAHGFAHWFVVYGNRDVGFILDAGDFMSSLIPPIPLRALSNPPSTVTIWGVVIETDQVVSVFEMPTIWDALSIDRDTPFSYFPKFFRDPSPEIEQRIQDVRAGNISSYSAVVQILRPGSVLRKGRFSVAKYGSSLICAFFDLEESRETFQRVQEQCSLRSFLMKCGKFAVWKFYDSYDCAQNVLNVGEPKVFTLNWSFVDREIDKAGTKSIFTTRMRNTIDLGHAFEIDMQFGEGTYYAWRGRSTAPHVVTGLIIDVTAIYSSPSKMLVNGKTSIDDTSASIREIKEIFSKVDKKSLNAEQIQNINDVIEAADELLAACEKMK